MNRAEIAEQLEPVFARQRKSAGLFEPVALGMELSAHRVSILHRDGERTEYTAIAPSRADAVSDALDNLSEVPAALVVSK